MDPIIRRNSTIPIDETVEYKTTENNQEFFTILILEGENRKAEDNFLVDQVTITGLRKAPAGQVRINVTFEVDTNGIFTYTVEEPGQQNAVVKRHQSNNFNLPREVFQELVSRASQKRQV